jgi:hypothetical protein
VSEYQYYDFKAIDHALTKTEMAALRAISTRAVITSTSFTNHYEWGDLKADPLKLWKSISMRLSMWQIGVRENSIFACRRSWLTRSIKVDSARQVRAVCEVPDSS